MRQVMRAIAVAVAIAGLIDPAWSAARPERRELVAIDLTSGQAESVMSAIRSNAPGWELTSRRADGARLPCATGERCVVISDGSIDSTLPADLQPPASLIAIRSTASPNVSIRSAVASATHAAAAGVVTVRLSRSGPVPSTDIRILDLSAGALAKADGVAVVGTASHKWTNGESATLEVPWFPIATGARTLRVEAVPFDGESAIDNAIDLGVAVSPDAEPVLVFDARPSWSSTFVRRALEDDPRFVVDYRARLAPSLSAGTRNGALDSSVLESTPVVVVGGPDALTAADVALLDRYVTIRGGSLILLPERRIDGPAARLVAGSWTEHLLTAPEAVGPLQASEIMRAERLPIAATILATSSSVPSIVSTPSGNGRVITSGAMDAWRYRQLSPRAPALSEVEGFDRFWRGLVSQSAAAGEALRIDVAGPLAAAAERVPITIRYRALEPRAAIEVKVMAQCGANTAVPVRVWPLGTSEFAGEVATSEPGQCSVRATAGDRTASTAFAVRVRPARGVEATLAALERRVRESQGIVGGTVDESLMTRILSDTPVQSSQIVSTHPMRSAWWIIPFAGCLAIEWWSRRRAALR